MDLASQQRAAPHGRGVVGRGQVRGTGSLRKGLDGRGGAGAKSHRRGTWGHLQYSDCLPATHGAHLRRPTRRLQAQAEPCGPGKNQTERVGRVPVPFQWELPQAEHFCFSFEGSKELGTVHGGMRAKRR